MYYLSHLLVFRDLEDTTGYYVDHGEGCCSQCKAVGLANMLFPFIQEVYPFTQWYKARPCTSPDKWMKWDISFPDTDED